MHKQTFTITQRLDGLNEYTSECRGNKFGGGKCKKKNEEIILAAIAKANLKVVTGTYWMNFHWSEARKTRDKDNVAFAKKFILDALQKAKITKGDDNRYLMGFYDEFIYGKGNGVVVDIVEKEKE